MDRAIRIAEEAIAQVSPDSNISREAQNAIAQWQQEATAKREQEAIAKREQDAVESAYKCSCQPSEPEAQQGVTFTESESDLTGSSCSINEAPEAPVLGAWVCNKN
jgi:DNA polymerase sigma